MHTLTKTALLFCLAVSGLFAGTGCSALLNTAATRNVADKVSVGTPREAVLHRLGSPRQTCRFNPPVALSSLPDAPTSYARDAKAAMCDDYRVSGLLVTRSNDDRKQWAEAYPWALIATGGLVELVFLPETVAGLGVRGSRHYHLRLWYDRTGHLLGETRRLEPLPPPPDGH